METVEGDGALTIRGTLTAGDRVALVRWLVERRGLGAKELDRAWKMGVVLNAAVGLLVGAWFTSMHWTGSWSRGAVVFLLSTTVFWAFSGGGLWLIRRARGGRAGDVERAIGRARRSIEAEHAESGDQAYELSVEAGGVRELLGDRERVLGWEDVDGAEVWTDGSETYAAVRTSDGLGMLARAVEPGEAEALVREVEARSAG